MPTKYVVMVLMYPGTRPQKVLTNRTKAYKHLCKIYTEMIEVLPDEGSDDGFREVKRIKNYGYLANRLLRPGFLHIRGTMPSGTTHIMTVKKFPIA